MDLTPGTASIRKELHRMADSLPEGTTWDDVMEEVYLQIVIDEGLKAGAAGKVKSLEEVRAKHGIDG